MTIDIKPETERVVREELLGGHFQSVDDLILSGVQAWRERNLPRERSATGDTAPVGQTSERDKAREFVEWAKSHPVTPPLQDGAISRASLNPRPLVNVRSHRHQCPAAIRAAGPSDASGSAPGPR